MKGEEESETRNKQKKKEEERKKYFNVKINNNKFIAILSKFNGVI